MIRINILVVGSLKDKAYESLVQEYLKRMSRFASVTLREVKDEQIPSSLTQGTRERILEKEWERIQPYCKGYVIALDERGQQWTTIRLADELKKHQEYTFIIGGALGMADPCRKKANAIMGLSHLTLPHALARLVLVEQLYRATSLNAGHPYHIA